MSPTEKTALIAAVIGLLVEITRVLRDRRRRLAGRRRTREADEPKSL